MEIIKVDNSFREDTAQSSNVINTARVVIRTVLDDDVPERLWSDGEKACIYLNNKSYYKKYNIAPYHFVIDSTGAVYQNRNPETDSFDEFPGFLDDIQVFLLCDNVSSMITRNYASSTSISMMSSLINLVSLLSERYNIPLIDQERNVSFLINENSDFSSTDTIGIFKNIVKNAIIQRNSRNRLYAVCENVFHGEPIQSIEVDRINKGRFSFSVLYPIERARLILKFIEDDEDGGIVVLSPGVDYNEARTDNDRYSNEVFFLKELNKKGRIDVIVLNGNEKVYQNTLIRPIKVTPNLDAIERVKIGLQIDDELFALLNGHVSYPESVRITAKYREILWPSSIIGVKMEDDEIKAKLGVYEKEPLQAVIEERNFLNTPDRGSKRISSFLIFVPSDVRYSLDPYMKYILMRSKNILHETKKLK